MQRLEEAQLVPLLNFLLAFLNIGLADLEAGHEDWSVMEGSQCTPNLHPCGDVDCLLAVIVQQSGAVFEVYAQCDRSKREAVFVPETFKHGKADETMFFDLSDVGEDIVPHREILAERLTVPEIDAVDVGHNIRYTGFGSCLDKLGVGVWGSIER
ncbi:hypothetical protein HG530_008457 [Fusarium avenaceum]|nr:hypothetical protein HG530_008457 [Fusarium avenaceum]